MSFPTPAEDEETPRTVQCTFVVTGSSILGFCLNRAIESLHCKVILYGVESLSFGSSNKKNTRTTRKPELIGIQVSDGIVMRRLTFYLGHPHVALSPKP